MNRQKINLLQKWILKYSDRPAYINYKAERKALKLNQNAVDISESFDPARLQHAYKPITRFKHSGNCGDIIYSLPTVRELAKKGEAHFFLQLHQKGRYNNYHPLGQMMLTEKMVEMLTPLLLHQPFCTSCQLFRNDEVDYDLDEFRKLIQLQDRGSIARWYFYVYAVFPSLSEPWLVAPVNSDLKKTILIARSHRYRNTHLSYSFLKKYPDVRFIGVEEEFIDMRSAIPTLEYLPVRDFLEMATLINSCGLFIGNQSFPFAIAEALKVKRVLEVHYQSPNVIVEGPGGHDFLYQPHFEKIVSEVYATFG